MINGSLANCLNRNPENTCFVPNKHVQSILEWINDLKDRFVAMDNCSYHCLKIDNRFYWSE